ncbi:MAG: hypothetical protein ACYTGC_12375 [Planctomycetota bacterium]
MLTSTEQAEILETLAALADGHEPSSAPRSAPEGVRWSDVRRAVEAACNELGVEMAVVRRHTHDWGYRFELKTVEDRPAELTVRRVDGPGVYETTATVGRFQDDEDRAEALRRAFDEHMRAYGRKRRFEEGH